MSIVDFVWWNVTDNRAVTISTSSGAGIDVVVDENRGADRIDTSASLTLNGNPASGTASTIGRRAIEDGMPVSLSWEPNQPPTCAPGGSASCNASPEFAPINPPNGPGPYPAADYARSDADYQDFFASVLGSAAGAEATIGLRAEVSLDTQPPAGGGSSFGIAETELDTGIIFDAQRDFDSYFRLTLQSQALARLDDAVGDAQATTTFVMALSEQFGAALQPIFRPAQLNLDETRTDSGLSEDGTYVATPIFSYGSDSDLVYSLKANEQYSLRLLATLTASASLDPMEVPAPPSIVLLLTGVSVIMTFHLKLAPPIVLRHRKGIC
jgi:hypothetical protein